MGCRGAFGLAAASAATAAAKKNAKDLEPWQHQQQQRSSDEDAAELREEENEVALANRSQDLESLLRSELAERDQELCRLRWGEAEAQQSARIAFAELQAVRAEFRATFALQQVEKPPAQFTLQTTTPTPTPLPTLSMPNLTPPVLEPPPSIAGPMRLRPGAGGSSISDAEQQLQLAAAVPPAAAAAAS